jgi:shikimate kinase
MSDAKGLNNLVFLIGFMGAGKTTVGKALAAKVNFHFADVDDWIEAQTGKTVPEIFSEFGEVYFRRLETETLQSCARLKNAVISVGGGAFVREENRRIIQNAGRSIWLDCSLDVVISRIEFDGTRPLARNRDELQELLRSRITAYSLADFTVQVDDKNVEQVVDAIHQHLKATKYLISE